MNVICLNGKLFSFLFALGSPVVECSLGIDNICTSAHYFILIKTTGVLKLLDVCLGHVHGGGFDSKVRVVEIGEVVCALGLSGPTGAWATTTRPCVKLSSVEPLSFATCTCIAVQGA